MAIIVCPGSNRETNSAFILKLWDESQANCLVTRSEQGFVQGCGYDAVSSSDKASADSLINSPARETN